MTVCDNERQFFAATLQEANHAFADLSENLPERAKLQQSEDEMNSR